MEEIVVLRWDFSPPDWFGEPMCVPDDDYDISIGDGRVEVRMRAATWDADANILRGLDQSLDLWFLTHQLYNHRPYNLSNAASVCRLHPCGRKAVSLAPGPVAVNVAGHVDIVAKSKDGRTLYDSTRERAEGKTELARLAVRVGSGNPTLLSLLTSYDHAVTHPDNELVHLYEILEALSKEFGGPGTARDSLGVSKQDWSRLGQLANNMPLSQGRHCGKNLGTLRAATREEMAEARDIARRLVIRYIEHLDRQRQKMSAVEEPEWS